MSPGPGSAGDTPSYRIPLLQTVTVVLTSSSVIVMIVDLVVMEGGESHCRSYSSRKVFAGTSGRRRSGCWAPALRRGRPAERNLRGAIDIAKSKGRVLSY
jgi:hypothetical protein